MRYWKDIGLGFKTPKEAIEGNYVDKKCPFTGSVSIRGKIIKYIFFLDWSIGVLWSPPRWTEPSSWDVISFTMWRSTTDMRRDTRMLPCMFHPLSSSRKVISLLLDNAGNINFKNFKSIDPFARPSASTLSRSSPTKLSETWESSSLCSEIELFCTISSSSHNTYNLHVFDHTKRVAS